MEIVAITIEQQVEKRLRTLMDERMQDIILQVVKRAVPEISYRLIQDGYQADEAHGGYPNFAGDWFGKPGPPGKFNYIS